MAIIETFIPQLGVPLLFSGGAWADIFSGGAATGVWAEIGNTTQFGLANEGAETLKIPGRDITNFRQTKHSIALSGNFVLTIGVNDLSDTGLAMALLSTGKSALTQAAATAASASLTLVKDKWVKIAANKWLVDNVTISGKTEGVDFQVHYGNGAIMALNTATAGAQTVAYDLIEIDAGSVIVAGSNPSGIVCSLKFPCRRLDTNTNAELYIPQINLLPNGTINLASDAEQEVTFTGEPLSRSITLPSGSVVTGAFALYDLPEAA